MADRGVGSGSWDNATLMSLCQGWDGGPRSHPVGSHFEFGNKRLVGMGRTNFRVY